MSILKMNWFTRLFTIKPKKLCKCGEVLTHHRYGGYTRAHNALCNQAAGASGSWCCRCKIVVWDEPDFSKWIETQPEWIVPSGSGEKIRSFKGKQS